MACRKAASHELLKYFSSKKQTDIEFIISLAKEKTFSDTKIDLPSSKQQTIQEAFQVADPQSATAPRGEKLNPKNINPNKKQDNESVVTFCGL